MVWRFQGLAWLLLRVWQEAVPHKIIWRITTYIIYYIICTYVYILLYWSIHKYKENDMTLLKFIEIEFPGRFPIPFAWLPTNHQNSQVFWGLHDLTDSRSHQHRLACMSTPSKGRGSRVQEFFQLKTIYLPTFIYMYKNRKVDISHFLFQNYIAFYATDLLIFLTNANHAVPGMGGIAGGAVFGTGCEPGHQLFSSQPQNAQKFRGPKEILAHKAVLFYGLKSFKSWPWKWKTKEQEHTRRLDIKISRLDDLF